MGLNLDIVGRETTSEAPWSWTARDAIIYALGVGAGDSGHGGDDELALTTQNSAGVEQRVLPTFAVAMGMGDGEISMAEFGDFSLSQVLHAGQKVIAHAPLPAAGSVRSTRSVSAIYDKGRHALIETRTVFADAISGEPLVESIGQIMIREEGGFGGDPGPRDTWAAPDRPADAVVEQQTRPNQALIYRLSGDTNPLHSDPVFAARAGFPRPILHGLCTYGFAARALVNAVAGGDVTRLGSIGARFSAPVFPGDALQTRIWRTDGGARFQTFAGDRLVIDRGEFGLR